MRLHNKVAIVTGSGSGIGKAIARLFAKEGATVVVVDIDKSLAKETLFDISEYSDESTFYAADITNDKEMQELFKKINDKFNKIDILVNNAGYGIAAPIANTTTSEWEKMMNVNAKGAFLGCKFAIPYMQKQNSGVIINIASIAAEVGTSNRGGYCASKAAVLGITKSVAIDYTEYNIRSVSVSPGTTDSPWFDKIFKNDESHMAKKKSLLNRNPMKRMGRPEEIANMVSFLASDEASFITGSDFVVDGGGL